MTYRKFLILVTLCAFAFFLAVAFASVTLLSPILYKQQFFDIMMPLMCIGMLCDLAPLVLSGVIIGPLSLGPALGLPLMAASCLLYIGAIAWLLTRKYRESGLAHPFALPGMKRRLCLLFILMVFMGMGCIGFVTG